jgi:hypothetical protein
MKYRPVFLKQWGATVSWVERDVSKTVIDSNTQKSGYCILSTGFSTILHYSRIRLLTTNLLF